MRDLVYVTILIAFFAVGAAYIRACAAIIGRDPLLDTEPDDGVLATQAGDGVLAAQAGHGVLAAGAGHGVLATQAGDEAVEAR